MNKLLNATDWTGRINAICPFDAAFTMIFLRDWHCTVTVMIHCVKLKANDYLSQWEHLLLLNILAIKQTLIYS